LSVSNKEYDDDDDDDDDDEIPTIYDFRIKYRNFQNISCNIFPNLFGHSLF